jgi:hypothetical protein
MRSDPAIRVGQTALDFRDQQGGGAQCRRHLGLDGTLDGTQERLIGREFLRRR